MPGISVGFLHYSAPPVIGGVEMVMTAHARLFLGSGYPVTFIAGQGAEDALPRGAHLKMIPEISSQHADVLTVQADLDQGIIPEGFEVLRWRLRERLAPVLKAIDVLIVHNVFTKHFNLALSTVLLDLVADGIVPRCIHWGHDFTWTSPNSRSKVYPRYPWDVLRQTHPGVKQVVVSEQRRQELAEMMDIAEGDIEVIYNGVDLQTLLGLTQEGHELAERMDLFSSDLIMILPVRVTRAKNIELAQRVTAALKDSGRHPRLVVTGPPDPHDAASMDYYQSLLDLRCQLGLNHEVCFAFESGSNPKEPYYLTEVLVSDLMRASDLLLLPSHREGFGMPVLEAGMTGLPVVASERIPAAREIGGTDARLFNPEDAPDAVAKMILDVLESNPVTRLRARTRQNYQWERIFKQQIEPLLMG
jgi:glycosyltransferase involved in cell wall biosynthesis